jgi:hypothetical protein
MQNLAGLTDIATVHIQYTLPTLSVNVEFGNYREARVDLLSHADAKDGDLSGKMADGISAYT